MVGAAMAKESKLRRMVKMVLVYILIARMIVVVWCLLRSIVVEVQRVQKL